MISFSALTNLEIQQIREDPDNQDWYSICYRPDLSEDFMREFLDRFNLDCLISYQNLPESFLISIKDKLTGHQWYRIGSFSDNLSEDFIREFQDKLDWYSIAANQKTLSKEFIVEFIDYIPINALMLNFYLSDEIKEFCRMFL